MGPGLGSGKDHGMKTRQIENSDIWAAIRGLGMYRMTKQELLALSYDHINDSNFAGRVISVAARQVASTKLDGDF
jgi:hypothetical protein